MEVEHLKREKEVKDIISERDNIQKLLNESKWYELQEYLQKLNFKYAKETAIYNMANPNMPKNTQENAQNCILFLNTLLAAKTIDTIKND